MNERYLLAKERLTEIQKEKILNTPYVEYFQSVAEFLLELLGYYECDMTELDEAELSKINSSIYVDIIEDNYDKSYANPTYAREVLGEDIGPVLAFIYTEMRGIIPSVFEKDVEDIVIHLELFIEVYCLFYQEDSVEDKRNHLLVCK